MSGSQPMDGCYVSYDRLLINIQLPDGDYTSAQRDAIVEHVRKAIYETPLTDPVIVCLPAGTQFVQMDKSAFVRDPPSPFVYHYPGPMDEKTRQELLEMLKHQQFVGGT